MIVPGSANALMLGQSSATGYNLTNSLRFRGSANAYLNRTPSSTATSSQKFTISFWVKLGLKITSSEAWLFDCYNQNFGLYFNSNSAMPIQLAGGAGYLVPTQVFRDPSAWYHIVIAVDTTQATASNRIRYYVNGSEVTSFSTANYPSQNTSYNWNSSGNAQYIGTNSAVTARSFDGYITEFNSIDGQQLTPSSFGENNADTGVWQPKRYTGTYGTNGFYLPFTNTTSTTTLGYDFSGNSNNWTTNNFSLTAGSTYDSMTDVPTLTSATTANYAVANPLDNSNSTFANGNLQVVVGGGGTSMARATIGASSGKWYWEVTKVSGADGMIGICNITTPIGSSNWTTANGWAYYQDNGYKYNGGSSSAYGATYTNGDVIGVALDCTNGTLTFYKNGTSQGTAYSTGLTGLNLTMLLGNGSGSASQTYNVNFGQQPFTYTPPTGYVALNTYNLPTSTIVKGNTVMDATLYTGNGSTQSITNAAGFKPDLVWAKVRSTGYSHRLVDSVRGATKLLYSDQTLAETTDANSLTSFNSNGFSLGNAAGTNENAATFVGWQWQAGQGTTSSNTNGSITSTVSVNATAGFSVVTYTGNGSTGTIGHGLGVAPSMIIVKERSTTRDWIVYHKYMGTNPESLRMFLNLSDASGTSTANWNNTAPTSSVFSVGSTSATNEGSGTYVAYCWAAVAGFSAFGSYTGNGSANGPFVYLGFRPRYLMIKRTDSAGSWFLVDTARNPYNIANLDLFANTSDAEAASNNIDILSNGFRPTDSNTGTNASGGSFVYAAFAENPFKNALAR